MTDPRNERISGAPLTPRDADISDILERVGLLLELQDANSFRVRAWRRAARIVRELDESVADRLDRGGCAALEELDGIGPALAAAIDEIAHTGSLRLLERLEGQVSPEDLFETIPGIGPELAERIHEHLHIETLEELEAAAHDGRLLDVPGFGLERVRGVREYLAATLSRSVRRRARQRHRRHDREAAPAAAPPVSLLLAVDAEYRARAEAGDLRTIAPRRFNPEGRAWLPVFHTEAEGWHLTALYSNTARAHDLGRTRDWVVIFYEKGGHEDQCTVVTETRGPERGRRVVRGRELECARFYARESIPEEVRSFVHDAAQRL